ncbi:MAG: M48 family metallopeptidase [Nitrospira sp. CG24D]|nr:MAG: M48 family metallopeptidase [Nitrospira sp. CG24D]
MATVFSANALCFGEEFPASGAPCLVQIDGDGLTITYESTLSTSPSERVLFTGLAVSAGGLDHDHLVLKWGEGLQARTLYLKHPDLIRAFREAAPDHLSQPFEQAAERVRQVRHRHRVMWGTVAGSIMAVALGLWFGADLLVEMAVSRIPVEWEQKLGEAAYKDFLSHQDVMKEGPAVKAVEEMTQRLADQIPNNRYKFQVTVVKSDVVNAFALPGGYVVVFTGLMKKADSGEEVAGVLGHELNHVLQRHGLERIVKNLGIMAVVAIIVGDQQGLIGLMRQVGVELLTLKFDRAQEMEADLTGLQLVYRAKIDPKGMITFFQKLSEKDEGRLEWLSTHPMSSARADRLKAELAALPKRSPEPFTFQWSEVQGALGVSPVAAP